MKEADVLQEIGLEKREANLYLMLLRLGPSTASKLADQTQIDRTTTYDILARLMKKGLVSYVIRNNVKYFQAAPPEQMLIDMQEKERKLESIMPSLIALQKLREEETKVEVYKGKEGIRTLYKMILKDKKGYYWIGGGTEACSRFPKETELFVRKAHLNKIKGKLVLREDAEFFIGKSEKYKLIPRQFISSTTTTIWGNKTGIFVWTEPFFAIVIENKEVAESNRNTFNYLWGLAKEPSKKHEKRTKLKE